MKIVTSHSTRFFAYSTRVVLKHKPRNNDLENEISSKSSVKLKTFQPPSNQRNEIFSEFLLFACELTKVSCSHRRSYRVQLQQRASRIQTVSESWEEKRALKLSSINSISILSEKLQYSEQTVEEKELISVISFSNFLILRSVKWDLVGGKRKDVLVHSSQRQNAPTCTHTHTKLRPNEEMQSSE